MTTKYTPGPWETLIEGGRTVCDSHGRLVCDMSDCDPVSEEYANARLISAAPEMAEAIKGYLEWGAMTSSDRDLHESKFKAALQKAGVL